jgi:hypothetical protein
MALSGVLSLEESVDLSYETLRDDRYLFLVSLLSLFNFFNHTSV